MTTTTKREFREGIDVALLVVAFVVGAGSALIFKIMGLPAWVPALAAGAVIIAYAVATYCSKTARLEPEQIGDNCYYLGFCITLASLAYTLYALGTAGEDAALLSDVISGFGVALFSTVVGVMARVVLLQFRVDLAARDKEARSQLNQVMRTFHGEMQASVTSTRETITQIRQTLDEHNRETIDQNKRMQQSFEDRVATLVEEAVTGVKAAMDEVVESGKEMNRRLSASARSNTSAAEKALQSSMETVTEDLKRAAASLEEQMQRANSGAVETLERVVQDVSNAMARLSEEATTSIEASRQAQSADMTKAVESVASNVFELASQIGTQKDKLREALDGFSKQTEAASLELSALVKESAKSREENLRAVQAVEIAAKKVAGSAEQVTTAVSKLSVPTVAQPQSFVAQAPSPQGALTPKPSNSLGNGSSRNNDRAAAPVRVHPPQIEHPTGPNLPSAESRATAPSAHKADPEPSLKSITAVPLMNNNASTGGPTGRTRERTSWFARRK